jgi:hypothetical protein
MLAALDVLEPEFNESGHLINQ